MSWQKLFSSPGRRVGFRTSGFPAVPQDGDCGNLRPPCRLCSNLAYREKGGESLQPSVGTPRQVNGKPNFAGIYPDSRYSSK
jgi:hypothetical protein